MTVLNHAWAQVQGLSITEAAVWAFGALCVFGGEMGARQEFPAYFKGSVVGRGG